MIITAVTAAMLASTAQAAPTVTPPAAPEKMICRRFGVTGSLVKKRKVCYTKAQWARLNMEEGIAARNFVQENQNRPPGGP